LFLQHLEGVTDLNVPKVIGYGHPEPFIEYTLMTRMPGVAVCNAKLEGETRQEALRTLGRMLRHVHSIPQAPLRESGLFFGDQSPVDVRWRMGELFDDVAERIKNKGITWNFPLLPEMIGRCIMATLPDVKDVVALHSNPGPEHTFVDPATGKLTGIIDFGDAYISHPVNDLRRYRAPEDRWTVLAGYLDGGPVNDDFMAVWRMGCAIADILTIAFSQEHQPAASAELKQILEEIG
jgi:hygromycin-B 7''-O-kinase